MPGHSERCAAKEGVSEPGEGPDRVAVPHRKVRETRLDHAHKTELRLIRENQAVYAEDLAVCGLARTRLAKSVHDAGWSRLLRLMEEKADHYGRTFCRIGRFAPFSQVCSECGVKDGPKPLSVRNWTCAACGARHDRDVNAARNILAAGRGQAKRLWRECKSRSFPANSLRSRNPPRCRMSSTAGIPAVHSGEDVNQPGTIVTSPSPRASTGPLISDASPTRIVTRWSSGNAATTAAVASPALVWARRTYSCAW